MALRVLVSIALACLAREAHTENEETEKLASLLFALAPHHSQMKVATSGQPEMKARTHLKPPPKKGNPRQPRETYYRNNPILDYDLIKYPVLTEKSIKNIENHQTYTFAVAKDADKPEIKAAIEGLFNVSVKKLNTLNAPPKRRRVGKTTGKARQYKRAFVRVKEGDSITLFEEE